MTDKLTVLDPSRDIISRDNNGLTGRMSAYFKWFLRLVAELLSDSDEGKVTLADDTEIGLEKASAGYGFCQIGDNQEYAQFSWTTAGVVTLIANSANAVNTDTDAKLCIYDSGTQVKIKNRLGSSLNLRFSIKYNPI